MSDTDHMAALEEIGEVYHVTLTNHRECGGWCVVRAGVQVGRAV